jgi:sodium-independent sulfate anion transporter 11
MAARPTLRAVILDFTAVNFLDVTAAQALVDLRNQFDRYAAPDRVEWYFAGVSNRWTKRALVASGFGVDRNPNENGGVPDEPLIALAEADGGGSRDPKAEVRSRSKTKEKEGDVEAAAAGGEVTPVPSVSVGGAGRLVPLYGVNRPFFHVDVGTALASAIRSLEGRRSGLD